MSILTGPLALGTAFGLGRALLEYRARPDGGVRAHLPNPIYLQVGDTQEPLMKSWPR